MQQNEIFEHVGNMIAETILRLRPRTSGVSYSTTNFSPPSPPLKLPAGVVGELYSILFNLAPVRPVRLAIFS
jgi:hypothetical protein